MELDRNEIRNASDVNAHLALEMLPSAREIFGEVVLGVGGYGNVMLKEYKQQVVWSFESETLKTLFSSSLSNCHATT